MRHLLSLKDLTVGDLRDVLVLADHHASGGAAQLDGSAAMFFPPSSLRTRFSFERGAAGMGLQPVTFPPETLDKGEDLADVAGYLAQWADLAVVRHPDATVLERLAGANALPVINAMTDVNHPREVLSDRYALSQDADAFSLRYLFAGGRRQHCTGLAGGR